MACKTILSDFDKPFKFGNYPVVVSQRDIPSDIVANVVLTDPSQYAIAPTYGRDPSCIPAGEKGSAIDLWWLNGLGGYDRWLFSFKASYSTEIGDGRKWQSSAGSERYSFRGDIRERVSVVSQFIDYPTRKALANIRKSIQVYQLMGDGDWTKPENFVPVVIDSGTFADYVTGDAKYQVDLSFYYAHLVEVQTQ